MCDVAITPEAFVCERHPETLAWSPKAMGKTNARLSPWVIVWGGLVLKGIRALVESGTTQFYYFHTSF